METELPIILYSYQMKKVFTEGKTDCKAIYAQMGLTDIQTGLLCTENSQEDYAFDFDVNSTIASNALM